MNDQTPPDQTGAKPVAPPKESKILSFFSRKSKGVPQSTATEVRQEVKAMADEATEHDKADEALRAKAAETIADHRQTISQHEANAAATAEELGYAASEIRALREARRAKHEENHMAWKSILAAGVVIVGGLWLWSNDYIPITQEQRAAHKVVVLNDDKLATKADKTAVDKLAADNKENAEQVNILRADLAVLKTTKSTPPAPTPVKDEPKTDVPAPAADDTPLPKAAPLPKDTKVAGVPGVHGDEDDYVRGPNATPGGYGGRPPCRPTPLGCVGEPVTDPALLEAAYERKPIESGCIEGQLITEWRPGGTDRWGNPTTKHKVVYAARCNRNHPR